jgi:hypothetical protein
MLRLLERSRISEHTPRQTLVCKRGSAINPLGPPAPLRGMVARAATRRGLHRPGQMPRPARIRRRTQAPEDTLAPPLTRLSSSLFGPNSPQCRLKARCLTTIRSVQISRHLGNPLRRHHRPRSAQLRPSRRYNGSLPPLTLIQGGSKQASTTSGLFFLVWLGH